MPNNLRLFDIVAPDQFASSGCCQGGLAHCHGFSRGLGLDDMRGHAFGAYCNKNVMKDQSALLSTPVTATKLLIYCFIFAPKILTTLS